MLGTLLAWLNPFSTLLGQIQQWEAKLLDAKTEQERIAAQEWIADPPAIWGRPRERGSNRHERPLNPPG